MPNEIRIELVQPLTIDGGMIDAITLRAPTLTDMTELGAPAELRSAGDDVQYAVEHHDVIDRYIRRCIIAPDNSEAWLGGLGLTDTLGLINVFRTLWRASDAAAREMNLLPINTKG